MTVRADSHTIYEAGNGADEVAALLGIDQIAAELLIHRSGASFRPLPPLNRENLQQIAVDRFARGLPMEAIANLVGRNTHTIRAWLRKAGFDSSQNRPC